MFGVGVGLSDSWRRHGPLILPYKTGVIYHFEPLHSLVDLDGDGLIRQIFDASGNGRHSTSQSDATKRPLWKASGIGGRPSWVKGSNSAPYIRSATLNLSYPLVAYLVLTSSVDPANGLILDGNASGSRAGLWYVTGQSTTPQAFGATGTISGTKTLLGTPTLFTVVFNGASSELRANGASLATGTLTTAAIDSMLYGVRFSLTVPSPVEYGLGILQSGALSAGQLSANESAIASRWNL